MKARLAGIARGALPALILLPAATALGACSFSASASTASSIKGPALAAEIEQQLVRSNPGLTVTGTQCPDTPKIVVGGTTPCTATVDGETTRLVVTWKTASGDYSVTSVD